MSTPLKESLNGSAGPHERQAPNPRTLQSARAQGHADARCSNAAARTLLLCASTQYWDEAWFRKQHFMSRLSSRYPVLYIEPSFSILRRAPKRCPRGHENSPWRASIAQKRDQLWTYTPPRGMPFWTHPSVSRVQYRRWGAQLQSAARELGFERTWLWLYNPLYIQTIETLAPERVIFDLVDDLEAYQKRAHSRPTMRASIEGALRRADLLFTTSPLLAHKYAPLTSTRTMHVVPNGVRGEWIERSASVPEDLRELPRPWIGFIGAIFCYLDYDLLVATARAFRHGTLVMVGPIEDAAGAERLAAEPNVAMLGPRPQDRVPEYAGVFDVCLSPFKAGDVRRAVNPLKIYEYLAAGRPVVSTPLESLADEPIARWLRFAEGEEAFVNAVRDAVASHSSPELVAARREAVRPYAWEALSARVEEIVQAAEERWTAEARA